MKENIKVKCERRAEEEMQKIIKIYITLLKAWLAGGSLVRGRKMINSKTGIPISFLTAHLGNFSVLGISI